MRCNGAPFSSRSSGGSELLQSSSINSVSLRSFFDGLKRLLADSCIDEVAAGVDCGSDDSIVRKEHRRRNNATKTLGMGYCATAVVLPCSVPSR